MAAFRRNLVRLVLSTSSLRPVPATLPASSRFYDTFSHGHSKYNTGEGNPFYVVCGPCPTTQTPCYPPLHHEHLVRNLRDGFHIRLYMAGVGKEGVKLWIEGDELIAEGVKDKDFDNEDDATTNTLLRYRMLCPHGDVFDLDAIKAEVKDGMMKVFVPRRDPSLFVPRA
ncbi:hypothetical protein CASFOL_023197 [Castilleja foliolosa]|uniref:SHSP domain-containing protein n=1 Tax=Castilleja foliolosa TaxID=1961234 RepID=A0ABD3CKQ7_9LAMI